MTTPFYELALNLFKRTQKAQIEKGIQKYPEPFNPRSWTPQELLNHALEETVDLTHYLVGIKTLLDDRDQEIRQLKHEIELLKGEHWKPLETKRLTANFEGKVLGRPRYFDQDDQHD